MRFFLWCVGVFLLMIMLALFLAFIIPKIL